MSFANRSPNHQEFDHLPASIAPYMHCPLHPLHADAKAYGWDVPEPPQLQWSRFIENKNNEILRLNGIYNGILTRAGVEILKGKGTFVDKNTVAVVGEGGEKRYTAKTILIAVGGWPFVPDIPGKELVSRSWFRVDATARPMVP